MQTLTNRPTGKILPALATLTFVAASSLAQTPATALPTQMAHTLRLTVAPKTPTSISVQTLPKGTCTLHAAGTNDASQSLTLFADDNGAVRFHVVAPDTQSDQSAQFQIDCQADGKVSSFPLAFRPNSSPTPDMPSPSSVTAAPIPGSHIRPALTADTAVQLSAEDLKKGEYPPRPDAAQSPDAFAHWLKAVTKPATYVPARLVSNPAVSHKAPQVTAGPSNSSNWSGFQLRGSNKTFDTVFGEWTVPPIALANDNATYSAFWIGIDGAGTNDLVQDGTEQDLTQICIGAFGCFNFNNYYAWSEFLPQQPTEQVVGNFTVNPGDEIYSNLSMCSFSGPFCFEQYNGAYAAFLIEDITRSEYTLFHTARGNTNVGGSQAEWIMERPKINGALPALAAYMVAFMWDAYACNTGFPDSANCMNYNSPKSGVTGNQISMYNGSDLLSFPMPVSSTEMLFQWANWQ